MMGFGVYLAACGYEYHGPKGHLGFAPRIHPEDFRAAFTAAEGWGLYRQRRTPTTLTAAIEIRYGRASLTTLSFETTKPAHQVEVRLGRDQIPARVVAEGNRAALTLSRAVVVTPTHPLNVTLS
jgi:hypothetical protein